ncbi:hypothetical protein [Alkalihalobacillus sp. BA299]|uniref:hypothetical protein n=1 Tax=Alkalihalobacillus sp. BA299 TaxID=2815938 RepID=UPI001AD9E10D|nr:hypothetical protein [Alkalihalobacillus sp. BA299]
MSGLIFAFFACAILFLFSTGYIFLRTVKRAQDNEERKNWKRYGLRLGFFSFLFLGLAIWLLTSYY